MEEMGEVCKAPYASSMFPPVQTNMFEVPGRRDAARHRHHILAVARSLFAENGVDTVSMHQIAQEAQVGQGTLYRHFAHKGMLCLSLLNEDIVRFQQNVLSYFEQVGSTVPVLVQLRFLFEKIARNNEENAPLFLNAMRDSMCGNRRDLPFTTHYYAWIYQVIEVLLQQAVERKEIAPLDIEYTTSAIIAPLSIELYYYQRYELGYELERILSGLDYLLFHGLRPDEA